MASETAQATAMSEPRCARCAHSSDDHRIDDTKIRPGNPMDPTNPSTPFRCIVEDCGCPGFVRGGDGEPRTEAKRERRQKVKLICDVLRSDLYERGKSHDDEDNDTSATWWSPLKLSVTYGYDDADPEQRVWIRCRDSWGKVYAETPDGDDFWLDGAML